MREQRGFIPDHFYSRGSKWDSPLTTFAKKSGKGFTLIELLVVIAIIGMLSSVVLASLNSARAKSRDARRAADMKQMAVAVELYYTDNGQYPIGSGPCGPGGTYSQPLNIDGTFRGEVVPNYISVLPVDPKPSGGSIYNGLSYATSPDRQSYVLLMVLEKTNAWCNAGSQGSGDPCAWRTSYPTCQI